jgi:hypothetical protein
MLRAALLLGLMLLSLAHAINPVVYEQDDNGDISLQQFTYVLRADCDAATITIIVKDANLTPVPGANAYLKYVDVTEPVMGKKTADGDGEAVYQLPGNVSLMRGLFILVIQKDGYRDKEVHFDLSPCYPAPAPPKKPAAQNKTNPAAIPPPKNSITPQNTTNHTNETQNASGPDGATPQNPPALHCPAALILLQLSILMFYKSLKP